MDEQENKLITEVFSYFQEAESLIKEFEIANGEVLIPAINELRYAGFHLIRFYKTKNEEELKKSKRHCERAIWDSLELMILFFIDRHRNFQEVYQKISFEGAIDGYSEISARIEKAKKFLKKTQKIRENNDSIIKEIKEARAFIEELETDSEVLEGSRYELNKRAKQRINRILYLTATLGMSIIGLMISIFLH